MSATDRTQTTAAVTPVIIRASSGRVRLGAAAPSPRLGGRNDAYRNALVSGDWLRRDAGRGRAAGRSARRADARGQARRAGHRRAGHRPNPRVAKLKEQVMADVSSPAMFDLGQVMTDQVFSYGELGLPGVRDAEVPDRRPEGQRLHHRKRRRRHSDRVGRQVGFGPAGDRARVRRGLHPAGLAEAGRGLPRSDRRRRTGPRRRPQLGHAAEHRGGAGGEAHHGARAAARHDPHLAGRGRRTARHQGLLRALGDVQGRGPRDVQPRRVEPRHGLGRQRR